MALLPHTDPRLRQEECGEIQEGGQGGELAQSFTKWRIYQDLTTWVAVSNSGQVETFAAHSEALEFVTQSQYDEVGMQIARVLLASLAPNRE